MDDRARAALRGALEPRWTERRAIAIRIAIAQRVRRRALYFYAVAAVVVGALGVGLAVILLRGAQTREAPGASWPLAGVPASPASTAQAPGPIVTPLTADTEVVVDPEGSGRTYLLRKGGARFIVAHDKMQPFRVRAGPLLIDDLGTVFTVVRVSDDRFDIMVERGQVRVTCGARSSELAMGERRVFECAAPSPQDAGDGEPRGGSQEGGIVHSVLVPSWRKLAENGQYGEAYESLRGAGSASVRDRTDDLLLAADAARLSGHPRDSVPYLQRALDLHGGDPRAQLAAFTLGRVLLDELGRPAEAAQAFERARVAGSPLAEDALAREVEACSRAGDTIRARALAVEYERQYPSGRRAKAVAKFGGIE